MDEGQRRLHRRVLQVGEILVDLLRREHAFVDEGLLGKAGDVPILGTRERRGADLRVAALPHDVELALKRHVVGHARGTADERLAHEGLHRLRRVAQHRVVGLDRAPAEEGESLRLHDLLEALLDAAPHGGIAREVEQTAAVLPELGKLEPSRAAGLLQEAMRHLDEDARAIARVDLGAARTAMVEVAQDLQAVGHDPVRLAPVHVDDEAHPAGVVLEERIVQALFGRLAGGATRLGAGRVGGQVGGAAELVVHVFGKFDRGA